MPELTISFATKKQSKQSLLQQQSLSPKAKQTKEHAQAGTMTLTKSWVTDPYKKKKRRREESVARTRLPPLIFVGGEAASNEGVQPKFASHPHAPAMQLFEHRTKFPLKAANLRTHIGDSVL